MLHIFVDADACPVKDEVYRVAKRYALQVTLVSARWLRVPNEAWLRLEVVKEDGQLDAADNWIVEHAGPGDIVISDDILLAERVLASGARAMSTRGRAFTPETIGEAVAIRELMAGLRETGETTGGPPPFSKRDRSNFLQRLDETVNAIMRTRDKQGPG